MKQAVQDDTTTALCQFGSLIPFLSAKYAIVDGESPYDVMRDAGDLHDSGQAVLEVIKRIMSGDQIDESDEKLNAGLAYAATYLLEMSNAMREAVFLGMPEPSTRTDQTAA